MYSSIHVSLYTRAESTAEFYIAGMGRESHCKVALVLVMYLIVELYCGLM